MKAASQQLACRVSSVTIFWNGVLSAFKFAAGLFSHSSAMLSDAAHSASDVLSTVVVLIGVRLSAREADKGHPYGHERLECAAALVLAMLLVLTGAGIGLAGLEKIFRPSAPLAAPGPLALAAAAVSIAVKEVMYRYTRRAALKIQSTALMADAWHHRSDALSSVGSFAGVLGARLGFPVLDPLASLVICLFILKAGLDVFRSAMRRMTDHACDDGFIIRLEGLVLAQPGVEAVDLLQTRLFGDRVYVDLEVAADGDLPLRQAHAIAEALHRGVESAFPEVKHCMVHVNPTPPSSHSAKEEDAHVLF